MQEENNIILHHFPFPENINHLCQVIEHTTEFLEETLWSNGNNDTEYDIILQFMNNEPTICEAVYLSQLFDFIDKHFNEAAILLAFVDKLSIGDWS